MYVYVYFSVYVYLVGPTAHVSDDVAKKASCSFI